MADVRIAKEWINEADEDYHFKKIHDLTLLLEICAKKENSFNSLLEEAKLLTDFYTDTRYPAFWPIGATREEAGKAKEAAEKIGKFVKEKIKPPIPLK